MYKTITMSVDVLETALSDKAVRHVESLAQRDGMIYLFHVLPGSVSFTMSRSTADLQWLEEHLWHGAETRLQAMVSHFSIDPLRIKSHIRFGSVRDMANEPAGEINADVVVVGSRNPFISTHLLGSNASSVICYTHISVVVTR